MKKYNKNFRSREEITNRVIEILHVPTHITGLALKSNTSWTMAKNILSPLIEKGVVTTFNKRSSHGIRAVYYKLTKEYEKGVLNWPLKGSGAVRETTKIIVSTATSKTVGFLPGSAINAGNGTRSSILKHTRKGEIKWIVWRMFQRKQKARIHDVSPVLTLT